MFDSFIGAICSVKSSKWYPHEDVVQNNVVQLSLQDKACHVVRQSVLMHYLVRLYGGTLPKLIREYNGCLIEMVENLSKTGMVNDNPAITNGIKIARFFVGLDKLPYIMDVGSILVYFNDENTSGAVPDVGPIQFIESYIQYTFECISMLADPKAYNEQLPSTYTIPEVMLPIPRIHGQYVVLEYCSETRSVFKADLQELRPARSGKKVSLGGYFYRSIFGYLSCLTMANSKLHNIFGFFAACAIDHDNSIGAGDRPHRVSLDELAHSDSSNTRFFNDMYAKLWGNPHRVDLSYNTITFPLGFTQYLELVADEYSQTIQLLRNTDQTLRDETCVAKSCESLMIKEYRDDITCSMEGASTATITSPKELLAYMEGIKYAIVGKGGNVITDLNSKNFYNHYHLLGADEVDKYQVGVCWDCSRYARQYFDQWNFEYKEIYIEADNKEQSTHTFIVYKDKGVWNIFEYAFESHRGIHSGFKSVNDCIVKMVSWVAESDGIDKDAKFKFQCWEIKNACTVGASVDDYMTEAKQNKLIVVTQKTIDAFDGKIDASVENLLGNSFISKFAVASMEAAEDDVGDLGLLDDETGSETNTDDDTDPDADGEDGTTEDPVDGDTDGEEGTDDTSADDTEEVPTAPSFDINDPKGITITLAEESDTFDMFMFRRELAEHVEVVLANPPENMSARAIVLLRKLRLYWWNLIDVDCLYSLVSKAIKLPIKYKIKKTEE